MSRNQNKATIFSILASFTRKILKAFKYLIKNTFKLFFYILKEILINKPSLIFKSFKYLKWILRGAYLVFGSTFILAFNLFGLQEYGSSFLLILQNLGIISIFKNIGLSDLFRTLNTRVIDLYHSISLKATGKTIPLEIRAKAIENLEKEDGPFISRSDYKNAIDKVTKDEHWYYYLAAKITTMIIISLIIYFFGTDIASFFGGVNFRRGDDDSSNSTTQDSKDIEVKDTRTASADIKGKAKEKINEIIDNRPSSSKTGEPTIFRNKEEAKSIFGSFVDNIFNKEEARVEKISRSLSDDEDFNPKFDTIKGSMNTTSTKGEMDRFFSPAQEVKVETAEEEYPELETPKPRKLKLPRRSKSINKYQSLSSADNNEE